jgi:multimeric flavodoxin WrbA
MQLPIVSALALNCTLKPSPEPSSTERMAHHVLSALGRYSVPGDQLRIVDLQLKPGVEADMGDGDQWPIVRSKIMDADILVFCTPTWLGHMSSVAQRVLERLDAELSATDEVGRPILTDKVAITAVVGNEDGAHKITADLYQALADVGFTIPAQGGTYWNGEAMQKTDFKDLEKVPPVIASTTDTMARNAAHLARQLHEHPYLPPLPGT